MVLRTIKKIIRLTVSKHEQKNLYKEEMKGGGTSVEVNLLLLAHALEKGMGLPHPRSEFGIEKAENLLKRLEEYHIQGKNLHQYAFVESLSVLSTYFEFTDNECDTLRKRCQALCEVSGQIIPSGAVQIPNIEEIYKVLDTEQIKYFIRSRHSIRSYRPVAVDASIVREAIELAQHAPSACNRQPVRVYWTCNQETVQRIDGLIPGNKGFEGEIPNWAIITVDRKMFGISEPLQWYVNGGIYLAYFVEALHSLKIGSCIFQIPATHQNTPELRTIASIPKNEAIIAAVGFGYPKSPNRILAATRKPADEVLMEF